MKYKMVVLSAVVGVLVVIAALTTDRAVAQNGTTKGSAAELQLLVRIPRLPGGKEPPPTSSLLNELRGLRTFAVDSFFDIEYLAVTNIGSSGQDGIQAGDSFFDITYRITGDPDFDLLRVSVRGTLANGADPGSVLDELRGTALRTHEIRGHVTLIK